MLNAYFDEIAKMRPAEIVAEFNARAQKCALVTQGQWRIAAEKKKDERDEFRIEFVFEVPHSEYVYSVTNYQGIRCS